MAVVVRLVTFVDIRDGDDDGAGGRSVSMSARHEAVLGDGRRVVLLDGRGWTEQLRVVGRGEPSLGMWAYETAEQMEHTARVVVGPDEPFENRTQADMDASHWDSLASVLREEGIEARAAELSALPHDVKLSERVLARLGTARGGLA